MYFQDKTKLFVYSCKLASVANDISELMEGKDLTDEAQQRLRFAGSLFDAVDCDSSKESDFPCTDATSLRPLFYRVLQELGYSSRPDILNQSYHSLKETECFNPGLAVIEKIAKKMSNELLDEYRNESIR
jgi:hypothetical protein